MEDLRNLCFGLAHGTSLQLDRAWQRLISVAELPNLCQECVGNRQLSQLKDSFHYLCEWDPRSLPVATISAADARIDWACRWVAAAVTATLTKLAVEDGLAAADNTVSTELACWGYRAAKLICLKKCLFRWIG